MTGIPTDGQRDVPDVSLAAAAMHDPYLICLNGGCASGNPTAVGGTSAGAPAFAGIMALVNQKTGARQGQANYVLYKLMNLQQTKGWSCNASSGVAPASTCIFNDITVGNNVYNFGTQYLAGPGYDQATGLGSVNAYNLVSQWNSVTFCATNTTLTINPTSLLLGDAASVAIKVTSNCGGTPTGEVYLTTSTGAGVQGFTLAGGSVISTTTSLPLSPLLLNGPYPLPYASYAVTAHYMGDATFATSDSAPVTVRVFPPPPSGPGQI